MSLAELLVVGIVVLIIVGPQRLPHLAYTIAKYMKQVVKLKGGFKAKIDSEIKIEELKIKKQETLDAIDAIIKEPPAKRDNK